MENNQNQDIFTEAGRVFFPKSSQSLTFYDMKGGVNNWSKGCISPEGDFVIRIYNNGKNL